MIRHSLRLTWIIIGATSLALGVAGVFLPLLPTTPFLLLTAYCFSKGSPRLHAWLLAHPYAGRLIEDWNRDHAIPKAAKWASSVALLSSILYLETREGMAIEVKIAVELGLLAIMAFILTRKTS